jgi:hypothetical protein
MANTDCQPCTGAAGVLAYIAGYAAKGEKQSLSYKQLMKALVLNLDESAPVQSMVAKTMMRLVGERDWLAGEVAYLLLMLNLSLSSRDIVHVDCRSEEN